MAARAQIIDEIIGPALNKGNIVVCDRFMDSTIAYQGHGLGIDVKLIKLIGKFATGGIGPDLTIFLDRNLKKGLRYRESKKDRIEKQEITFLKIL